MHAGSAITTGAGRRRVARKGAKSMKLLHFADLHLGVENYGRSDPATGLSTRLADFLRTFDEAIDYAVGEPVDAVLFAGDAFKTRDPNPTVQREFARRVRRLSRAGIPTVLLIGNHDLPGATSRATSVEIYDALGVDQVRVCRTLEHFVLETRGGPLQVVALPWLPRSRLLASPDDPSPGAGTVNDRIAANVVAIVRDEAEKVARNPDLPAVLLGHVSVSGAITSTEQSIMLGQDMLLSRADLEAATFDYVALGHIHKHQQLGPSVPPVVYSGSLERIDFGEEHEDKGFVVVEIDPARPKAERTTWTFHPVGARRFVTLRLTAGEDEPLQDVTRAIERRTDLQDAVVRAFITMSATASARLQLTTVRQRLTDAGVAYVAQVVPLVDRAARMRLPLEDANELDPLRMLHHWFEAEQTSPARREILVRYATELLQAVATDRE